jgi:hypothetical protein
LSAKEAHVLQCLGAAVLSQWNNLPTSIQRELFAHSFEAIAPPQAERLKRRSDARLDGGTHDVI